MPPTQGAYQPVVHEPAYHGAPAAMQQQQPDIRARALHTLKGTTACFGLQSVAHVAHQVENELADDPHFSPALLHRLRTAWNTALARLRTEIDIDDDSLVVPEREYEAALALVVNARPATPRISGVRTDPPCA